MGMTKAEMRQHLLTVRRRLDPSQRESAGLRIQDTVAALPRWRTAKVVGVYLALPDEVPTAECIRLARSQGKTVVSPVISLDRSRMHFYAWESTADLEPGPMGILQPKPIHLVRPEAIQMMLVPGVGFDLKGYRIGYGKGYYDRYLAGSAAWRLGLAFDAQIVPALPVGSHDCPMDCVVTETRLIP